MFAFYLYHAAQELTCLNVEHSFTGWTSTCAYKPVPPSHGHGGVAHHNRKALADLEAGGHIATLVAQLSSLVEGAAPGISGSLVARSRTKSAVLLA